MIKTSDVQVAVQRTSPFRIEESDTAVKLYLHGDFEHVEDNSRLISDLYMFSEKYNIIEIWISSNGGVVTLLTEILEALRDFNTIVTICNSTAGSAGAFIWGLGDIRVVSPYAHLMWHRESYGFFGKTSQHEDTLEQQKKIFPGLIEYCVGDILTEEEKEKCQYTEVMRTGQEMIDRGHAMAFSDYKANMNEIVGASRYDQVGMLYRDRATGRFLISDDEGNANSLGYVAISPYTFPFFDYAIGSNVRVTDDDGDTNRMSRDDFNEINETFYDMFSELYEEDNEVESESTEENEDAQ